jgi:glycosyltransferase involved in cell wall biosynthesis
MGISGYVPFFNNADTVLAAVDSLRHQEPPLGEVFAVDDGSTDGGGQLLEAAGVRVYRQPRNLGRGASRRLAMQEARNPFVLCCDATNVLPPDFCRRSTDWFTDSKVAAVFGRITQRSGGDAVTRWRGRHLFKIPRPGMTALPAEHRACLSTYGAIVRQSAVLAVGNYDPALRHSEDADLGRRLLAADWDVVRDPSLEVVSTVPNTLWQVLERYWRWYAGSEESISWRSYPKLIAYSIKSMAASDVRDGEIGCAFISLICPHYQFWRSLLRQTLGQVQR